MLNTKEEEKEEDDKYGIVVVENFFSAEECDQIIEQARSKVRPSQVWDISSGSSKDDLKWRKSEQWWMPKMLSMAFDQRVAKLTGIAIENGELWQVVHYSSGGYYREHFDAFDPAYRGNAQALRLGGNRIMTVLVYLNDVNEGGETYFPRHGGRKIKPKRGRAVVWYNMIGDRLNEKSIHAGLAPAQGQEKWIANKWLRMRPTGLYPQYD
jgi:prolyl 4-hydroxylase